MKHDLHDVKRRLGDRAEELVKRFFPAAEKQGNIAYLGSIRGEKGTSLSIWLKGPKAGEWFDHAAGKGGDALSLAQHGLGCDFREALDWAAKWTGAQPIDNETPEQRRAREARQKAEEAQRRQEEAAAKARTRKAALALWLSGEKIFGTPAERYLLGRAIDLRRLPYELGCLRFHPDCRTAEGQRRPALLAAVADKDGFMTVHRHFLHQVGDDWVKADDSRVPERDRMAKGQAKQAYSSYGGGMIAVWRGDGNHSWRSLSVGHCTIATEGLEDALSWALAMPDMRVCASISLANLGRMWLPGLIDTVFWHRHRGDPAQAVASYERQVEALAARKIAVTELWAPGSFKDANEWLQAQARGEA